MLTSATTNSVACEHSSRLHDRMIVFSSILPIAPSPSLRAYLLMHLLARSPLGCPKESVARSSISPMLRAWRQSTSRAG